MNFSGNRYTKLQLEKMLISEVLLCLVLKCADNFGNYGTIGFSVIRKEEPRMIDLMFSCRIQAKRVEHAFLSYVLTVYKRIGALKYYVDYRKTERNKQSGKVFDDLCFEKIGESDGLLKLVFNMNKVITDDNVIKVTGKGFKDESYFEIHG